MKFKSKIAAIALIGSISLGMTGCTAEYQSMIKDFESDVKGIHRIVKVIAMDGSVVETYESKNMRVSDGQGGTIILDFDDKRVVIANASVIIEEVK